MLAISLATLICQIEWQWHSWLDMERRSLKFDRYSRVGLVSYEG